MEIIVGDIVPDSKLGWFEAVVNKDTGFKLGIYRNIQAIIWDNKITENHLIEIYRNIKYKKIKVSDQNSKPNKNWVLPNALVKEDRGRRSCRYSFKRRIYNFRRLLRTKKDL